MGKDFTPFLTQSENEQSNFSPLSATQQNLSLKIQKKPSSLNAESLQMLLTKFSSQSFLSLLTAPLVTIHVSLQMSIFPNKPSFKDPIQLDLAALAKASKDIPLQDLRKYELLIKANATGRNKLFRPSSYGGYMDTIRGLANQGLLGFYKGSFWGIMYNLSNSAFRFYGMEALEKLNLPFYTEGNAVTRGVSVFLMCSAVDFFLQPIQTIQSRYILQNRLPNFSIYKSFLDLMKKHRKSYLEFYRGSLGHCVKNAVMGFTWTLYNKDNHQQSYIVSTLAGHILSYPILTAIRRIEGSSSIPGMIPNTYAGTLRAMKQIAVEEGVKGLYRGFIAYGLANTFLTGLVLLSSAAYNTPLN